MKLSLTNIGRIKNASIEITGITVIAGENDTGKSTIGRALFAVFNSFYQISQQIKAERQENIAYLISMMYLDLTNSLNSWVDEKMIARNIVAHMNAYRDNFSSLKDIILSSIIQHDENFEKYRSDSRIDEYIARIQKGLAVSDTVIFKSVLKKKLDAEFSGQINNIFIPDAGEITLNIREHCIRISIKENEITAVSGQIDLQTEAVYLDDPFALDEVRYITSTSRYLDHRGHLQALLSKENNGNLIDEIVASNKLENIYAKLSSICSGTLVRSKRAGLGYQSKNTDKILDVKNLSTGFKTFAILKTLLLNNSIEYNGTLILDEPEIHLHPEWQLLFAELIVLMQKEFGIHILLNTHSPYFLNAIEVYAAKYGIDDKCRYYLSSSQDGDVHIDDVTNHIEAIYRKLARPLQDLENERYSL